MEAVYAAQESFGNSETANMSMNQVIAKFGDLAQKYIGVDSSTFVAGLNDPNTDYATRISWKYGCSRKLARHVSCAAD